MFVNSVILISDKRYKVANLFLSGYLSFPWRWPTKKDSTVLISKYTVLSLEALRPWTTFFYTFQDANFMTLFARHCLNFPYIEIAAQVP